MQSYLQYPSLYKEGYRELYEFSVRFFGFNALGNSDVSSHTTKPFDCIENLLEPCRLSQTRTEFFNLNSSKPGIGWIREGSFSGSGRDFGL